MELSYAPAPPTTPGLARHHYNKENGAHPVKTAQKPGMTRRGLADISNKTPGGGVLSTRKPAPVTTARRVVVIEEPETATRFANASIPPYVDHDFERAIKQMTSGCWEEDEDHVVAVSMPEYVPPNEEEEDEQAPYLLSSLSVMFM
jgi:hypothetical protein